jgi:hypothetical protein
VNRKVRRPGNEISQQNNQLIADDDADEIRHAGWFNVVGGVEKEGACGGGVGEQTTFPKTGVGYHAGGIGVRLHPFALGNSGLRLAWTTVSVRVSRGCRVVRRKASGAILADSNAAYMRTRNSQ